MIWKFRRMWEILKYVLIDNSIITDIDITSAHFIRTCIFLSLSLDIGWARTHIQAHTHRKCVGVGSSLLIVRAKITYIHPYPHLPNFPLFLLITFILWLTHSVHYRDRNRLESEWRCCRTESNDDFFLTKLNRIELNRGAFIRFVSVD